MHRQQCSTHQEKCEKERDTHIISNYVDSGKIILKWWGPSDVGVSWRLDSLGNWGPLNVGVFQTLDHYIGVASMLHFEVLALWCCRGPLEVVVPWTMGFLRHLGFLWYWVSLNVGNIGVPHIRLPWMLHLTWYTERSLFLRVAQSLGSLGILWSLRRWDSSDVEFHWTMGSLRRWDPLDIGLPWTLVISEKFDIPSVSLWRPVLKESDINLLRIIRNKKLSPVGLVLQFEICRLNGGWSS